MSSFAPQLLQEQLGKHINLNDPLVIAYSGGVDSHVLLHASVRLGLSLRAVYINHGWLPNAKDWTAHCQQVCQLLKVPLQCLTVDATQREGQSPEESARIARYQALAKNLNESEVLVTGHQQDDQAETVLLHLLRGSGPQGLSGMQACTMIPSNSQFTFNKLLRPLLPFTRNDLIYYARQHHLKWIDDPSNQVDRFHRNYLRHRVLPVLAERWPSVSQVLARSATLCAETEKLLDEYIQHDWVMLTNWPIKSQSEDIGFYEQGKIGNTLPITPLLMFSRRRQKQLLRYWFKQLSVPLPSYQKMEQIIHQMLRTSDDTQPLVRWATIEMRRYKDRLYLQSSMQHSKYLFKKCLTWDFMTPLKLPESLGFLSAHPVDSVMKSEFLAFKRQHNDFYTVRFRQGGERCRLKGRQHSSTLKKLMQGWCIPPWLRDEIPLVYRGDQLIAVVGYCYCAEFDLPLAIDWYCPI